MKILFLFPHFILPGGAATVVLQFAKGLQLRGHKVEILCARVSKEVQLANPQLIFKQIKIPVSSSFFYWLFIPFWQTRINRQIRSYENYILFAHVMPSNWWAWMYKRRYRASPIVWYCHDPGAFIHSTEWINAIPNPFMRWGAKFFNPFLKKIDVALEKSNDIVICNSNFIKEQYQKIYSRKANGVIYPPWTPINIEIKNQKQDYIITACRISKFKNIDVLIRTFKIISEDLRGCKLLIAGDGEEKEALQNLTKDLRLESRVSFLGNQTHDQLFSLYQNAKVTVICSVNEPFGLVPIESMMCGTPVIAHNSGGPRETVIHNQNGFLYNNETELVQFVKRIFLMEKEQYFQMQKKCLAEVVKYDLSRSIIQLESIFQTMTGESHQSKTDAFN